MLVKFVIKEMLNEREKHASLPAGTAGADAGGGSGGVGRVPAVVSQWESGKTFPSTKRLVALSRLYGVPLEELYPKDAEEEGETEVEAAEEVPAPADDPPGIEIPPKSRRSWRNRIAAGIVFAAYISFAAGILLWGCLTNSNALAMSYLILGTVVLIVGWLVFFAYAIYKYIRRK